jgi:transcriptional regulator with XRE-family HTH domain
MILMPVSSVLPIKMIGACYNPGVNEEKALANRIRAARKHAGMTQKQLGEQLGIEQSSVSLLEDGSTEVGALRLRRIAQITGRRVEWLLGLESDLAEDEERLLGAYRSMPPDLQRTMLVTIVEMAKQHRR